MPIAVPDVISRYFELQSEHSVEAIVALFTAMTAAVTGFPLRAAARNAQQKPRGD